MGCGPIGGQAGGQLGLALQNHPVDQDLQPIGLQGRAGGRNIDHQFRRAGGRRPLGGAPRFDDAIIDNAEAAEKGAGLGGVFGGHPQAAAGAGGVVGGDLVHIGHGVHINPALGRGHHQVGAAKAQGAQQHHPILHMLAPLTQQILAGDAQVDIARVQGRGDIGRRQQLDHGPRQAGDLGPIAALATIHLQAETGIGQPGFALLLQAALGRQAYDQGRLGHATAPVQARAGRTMQPTAPGLPPPPRRAGKAS